MSQPKEVQEEWNKIHQFLRTQTDEQLGNLFREYLEESVHMGFDGFSSRDVTGIRRMLLDMRTYSINR